MLFYSFSLILNKDTKHSGANRPCIWNANLACRAISDRDVLGEKRIAALTRRVILEDSPGAWGMSSAHNIFPLNEGDGTSLGEILTQSWTAQRNK